MDKRTKNIVYLFGFFIVLILVIEIVRPQPVNWRYSFTSVDKIPFGGYVLYEELPSVFDIDKNRQQLITQSCFTFLTDNDRETDTSHKKGYFFINNHLYFDDQETEALLSFVDKGHTAFLSSQSFAGALADSLNIYTYTRYQFLEEEAKVGFYTPNLVKDTAVFSKVYQSFFTKIDTLNAIALGYYEGTYDVLETPDGIESVLQPPTGTAKKQQKEQIATALNFIKVPYGNGEFYIHTIPEAFSNYYLLNGNQAYAENVLSHLDIQTIYWDEYKKTGRRYVESPLRYVLSQTPLRWAYYLLVAGILLFVIFKAKRRQRIIPVLEPLQNTSVAFAKTIGSLYFQHRDYSAIIQKKIVYFLEQIRSKYYLDTSDLDSDFVKKLAEKSNRPETQVVQLVNTIKNIKEKTLHTEQDLIQLNKEIEAFNRT